MKVGQRSALACVMVQPKVEDKELELQANASSYEHRMV